MKNKPTNFFSSFLLSQNFQTKQKSEFTLNSAYSPESVISWASKSEALTPSPEVVVSQK